MCNKKEDGEYKELFKHGPIDPCSDEFKNDEKHKAREEHIKQFGNRTLDAICPFNEVSELFMDVWLIGFDRIEQSSRMKDWEFVAIDSKFQETAIFQLFIDLSRYFGTVRADRKSFSMITSIQQVF